MDLVGHFAIFVSVPVNKNLISLLVVAALFAGIIVYGLVGSIRTGNYVSITIVFTGLALCGIIIFLNHFRTRLFLREKTPDRIIAYYHKSIRRIPHSDAAAAYLSALAAAFFGKFDQARGELEAIDWNATTPMYRGHRLYVLSFLALLEETDYPKALRLADEAEHLESKDTAGGLKVLDGVIRLVADGATPERVALLAKVAKRQHGLMPGMCAWALAVHHMRTKEPEKAAEFKELLRMAVPHAAPMQGNKPVVSPGPSGIFSGPDA